MPSEDVRGLLAGIRERDSQALAQFIDKYRNPLCQHIRHHLRLSGWRIGSPGASSPFESSVESVFNALLVRFLKRLGPSGKNEGQFDAEEAMNLLAYLKTAG